MRVCGQTSIRLFSLGTFGALCRSLAAVIQGCRPFEQIVAAAADAAAGRRREHEHETRWTGSLCDFVAAPDFNPAKVWYLEPENWRKIHVLFHKVNQYRPRYPKQG